MSFRRRGDDWQDTLREGFGSVKDKSTGVAFTRRHRLSRRQLVTLFDQNALAARAVEKLGEEALREPWSIASHDGGEEIDMLALMQRIEAELQPAAVLHEASVWSRLFGGAAVVLSVLDGRQPSEPLDTDAATHILRPTVVTADDAIPLTYDGAFGSPTYRKFLSYQINNTIGGGTGSAEIEVHHSRVIRFEPIALPLEDRLESINGWGPSILERMYDSLKRYGSAQAHAVTMMYTASILYVKLQGVSESLKRDGGQEEVQSILGALQAGLTATGLFGLDIDDEVGSVQHTFAGAGDLIDRTRDAAAADAPMPREIWLNEQGPGGLNNGALSGPQALWFAIVAAYQKTVLEPALKRLLTLAFQIWDVPIGNFEIEWAPLWVPSEELLSEAHARNATADSAYIAAGVLKAAEVRKARFVDGSRGSIQLDPEVEAAAEVAAAAAEAEADELGESQGPDVPEPDDALDIREAARRLGMPTATLTAAIRRGELRHWQIGQRRTVSLAEAATLSRAHEATA